MDDEDKPKVVGITLLVAPLAAWFAVAKLYYGFTPQDARPRLGYMITHTFHLWPLWAAMLGGEVLAIVGLIVGFKLAKQPFAGAYYSRFYRGTKIVTAKALARLTRERNTMQVTIAGVPMPIKAEGTHLAIGGATGTGKTTLFKEMMLTIRKRQDRMLVLDPNGDYYSTFGRPGKDILLNPHDLRTQGWKFFNEIREDYDFDRLAKSLISPSKDAQAEEFNGYARLLFAEVARKLRRSKPNATMQDVYDLTNQSETESLKLFCEGTNAQGLFAEGADRALGSTRFVLSSKLPPHLLMPDGTFSLRSWVEDDSAGNLYITWDENMRESLRPLISTWTDIAFSAALGLAPSSKRRLWVFLDELESLNYLPTLGDALTKGRKHGLRVVTGWQTKSQIVEVYGPNIAETLLANHRSLVALGVGRGGHDTAEHMSKSLGEHEVLRSRNSRSTSMSRPGSNSTSDDVKMERVVIATEIMTLPDLEGYLSFPGKYPLGHIKFEPINYTRNTTVPGIVRSSEAPRNPFNTASQTPALIEGSDHD